MRYAQRTDVSVVRSKGEIETLLMRYGASQFVSGWEANRAVIGFRVSGRQVRFELPLPRMDAEEFRLTPTGRKKRNPADYEAAWEQACRQRWRALALVLKAKLEAVECGIATFESEFLSHIVIPGDGRTVGEWITPHVEAAYIHGRVLPLLPGAKGKT